MGAPPLLFNVEPILIQFNLFNPHYCPPNEGQRLVEASGSPGVVLIIGVRPFLIASRYNNLCASDPFDNSRTALKANEPLNALELIEPP